MLPARRDLTGPARVLVVADPPLADLVKLTLNHGEYDVQMARRATEAAQIERAWKPHLLIVDVDLRDGDTTQLIGENIAGQRIPTIVLTERGDLKTKLAAFERGADDFIAAPFSPEELVARSLALMRRAYGANVRFVPVTKVGELDHPDTDVPRSRVLLVIGKALANLVAVTLRHGAYETRDATDESEVRRLVRDWRPDMALVDVDHYASFMDLVGGGMAQGNPAILAFTRKRDTAVKLDAFERGADDLVEVPFTLDEIVARPYALMRRLKGVRTPLVPRIVLGGQLEVDLVGQTVKLVNGSALDLTPIQQTLLYILAANAGEVLTRETLLASIWGGAFQIESNVVDRHIRELRVKLNDDWRTPRYIETVAGRGYRFKA